MNGKFSKKKDYQFLIFKHVNIFKFDHFKLLLFTLFNILKYYYLLLLYVFLFRNKKNVDEILKIEEYSMIDIKLRLMGGMKSNYYYPDK